jgi:hypothetical protein
MICHPERSDGSVDSNIVKIIFEVLEALIMKKM